MSVVTSNPGIITLTETSELQRALLDARRCLARALADNIAMHETLAATQARCTELLLENRALRGAR